MPVFYGKFYDIFFYSVVHNGKRRLKKVLSFRPTNKQKNKLNNSSVAIARCHLNNEIKRINKSACLPALLILNVRQQLCKNNHNILFRLSMVMWYFSLKGCGMCPLLVLVSPSFRENVVVTCKIGLSCVV